MTDTDRLTTWLVDHGMTEAEARKPSTRTRAQLALGIPAHDTTTHTAALTRLRQATALAARAGGGSSTCSGCGALLRWAVTDAGRKMPLDPLPHPSGNVVLIPSGSQVVARVLKAGQRPGRGVPAYRAHFVTCASPKRAPQQRARCCPVCGWAMSPGLVQLGAATHPLCSPFTPPGGRPR